WMDGTTVITVTFQNGKVMGKGFFSEGGDSGADVKVQVGDQDPFKQKPVGNPNPLPGGVNPPGADPAKVTRANYDRIQNGMTENEVTNILGPPSTSSGVPDPRILQWNGPDKNPLITLHLHGGKVAGKFAGPRLK